MFLATEGFKNIVLSSDQMNKHGHEQRKGFLQILEFVEVKDCGDIGTLFSAKLRQALKNLKSVKILSCKSLEAVFELEEEDEESKEEEELPLLSSLTRLELSDLPELKCIWKGPTRHVNLHSLNCLILRNLDKLTFIFPPSLSQSLSQLETLEVENCRELKHVIREKDGDERKIIAESLGFPKLKTLYIPRCGKLEYVFPVSVSLTLQNLERMTISYVYNLKQIFGPDDHASPVNVEKGMVLPNLKELSLEQLSSIVCFSFGCCNFSFPRLEKLKVDEDARLCTKFTITPDGSMSAQSEVLLI